LGDPLQAFLDETIGPIGIRSQNARKGNRAAITATEDVVNVVGVFVSTLESISDGDALHREQAGGGADLNFGLILRAIRQLARQKNQPGIEKG